LVTEAIGGRELNTLKDVGFRKTVIDNTDQGGKLGLQKVLILSMDMG
jgi:hypothetical protein